MNKLLYILVLISTIVNAQFGPQQVISIDGDGPQSVFAADIDGDSYKDVLSANKFASTLTWYKNMGNGTFGTQQIISSLNQPLKINAADLDGDNDMDILATAPFSDLVVWYKNLDGNGSFSAGIVIANDADGANDVIAIDIDGDLDLDVISASDSSGLAWYENLDGIGNFSSTKIISTTLPNCRSVFAADIDGDGDFDLVTNASGSQNLFWFENLDGLGAFGPKQFVAVTTTYVNSVFCADLDGDDDLDIVTAIPVGDVIAWHENLDGLGDFGGEQVITTQADFARSVFATDLDNDNDMDVLSASSTDNKIAWYENTDGLGNFSTQQVITTSAVSAHSVFAADLDNDGDMDVLSASQNDDKIAWYENLTILGVEEILDLKIMVTPNPANTVLYISNSSIYKINTLQIHDVLGKLVQQVDEDMSQLDISNLKSGVYFVRIEMDEGVLVKKVLKE